MPRRERGVSPGGIQMELRCSMSEAWNKWIGQVVGHKYQLQQYLGTTDHSVVFLAEFHDPEPRQAAVKFISADFVGKEEQLATWKQAEQLNHPHLMRIYGSGACHVEEMDLLYVAMEYAEENLGQVLPHRALVAEEAKEMLNSIVGALVYLHDRDLVHGHIKPSNVLAAGDLLKLSSDTIFSAGIVREMRRDRSAYDAPELPDAPYTPAADVWSLGVSLVEALTQQPAVLPFNENAEPIIPATVDDPFLEVAGHTLRRNPRLRWSSGQLAEQLNPSEAEAKAVAAVAGARVSGAMNASVGSAVAAPPTVWTVPPAVAPLDVPVSKEPATPLRRLPPVPPTDSLRARVQSEQAVAPKQSVALPGYAIPLFAGALLVIALIVLPFALRHRGSSDANSASSSGTASSTQAAVERPSQSNNHAAAPTNVPAKSGTEVPPATSAPPAAAAVAPTHPAPLRSEERPATSGAHGSRSLASEGEALDQVRPTVSGKALSSIHGTVRVGVKVHVDAAGKVTEATLENSGPSRYFADVSLKAARQWVFTAPEADGHSAPSEWRIQFHYTQSGVQMSSEQLKP
jgi:TonB family protein